ncbi:hypothetical protein [Nesterenkonia rhizosphaerae]|uniref:Uncharacterized protein n=1 Tax=Nesterenkonia rhizosphaerae TaxID=1348272 RepID=A0ABP9G9K5_9MICC
MATIATCDLCGEPAQQTSVFDEGDALCERDLLVMEWSIFHSPDQCEEAPESAVTVECTRDHQAEGEHDRAETVRELVMI